MRLLVIGNFYAPEETGIAPYTTGLAEHMVRRGNDVTVVTALPSYPQWRIHEDYRRMLRRRELRGGVDVRRRRCYVPRRQSAVHRGLYEASFLVMSLSEMRLPRPDAILGVVPALSSGAAARIAGYRFGSPYGLIFQDLSGPGSLQSGMSDGGLASIVISAAEKWAARKATAIGIIADGFRPYLESIGVEQDRIHRVRNWMHIERPPLLDRSATRARLDLPQNAIVCLHAGNMGLKQGLNNLIECARLASKTDPRLLFTFVGDGSQRSLLADLASRSGLPNTRLLPVQPADFFPSVLASADILLVNQRSSVTSMSLPSKLTSYFASGRPVIAAVSPESEAASEIRNAGTGLLVQPDRPDMLLEAIRRLLADKGLQQRLLTAAKMYARTAMSADRALTELEKLIQTIAAPQATLSSCRL
jgi:colanic acid biosynthesis glycosyl transferase WcaI